MPNSFVRSKKADADIAKITKWSVQSFGVKQTQIYMKGMHDSFQTLADNPKLGRAYLGYFHCRYKSHVIYYRQRKRDIFIVRILHKNSLPEKHIKK